MQNRKGIIYPRIAEEIVDYAELQEVLGISYLSAYRIMHGHAYPNHKRKEKLSEYLGIPVNELWVKNPEFADLPAPSFMRDELTEEERQEHLKQYQHEYYMTKTKQKRAESRRDKSAPTDNSEII